VLRRDQLAGTVQDVFMEAHPILGFGLLLVGLLMIAFNEASARQYEESQKALGKWGRAKHAYITGRVASVGLGSLLTVLGGLMVYGF
jgi:hypothetical protein